jgi:hypothetical protein
MNPSSSDVTLQAALRAMHPIARMLVANGVTYPQFVRALKHLFLQAARDELARSAEPATDSALSLLSGVHRKDVRAMKNKEAGAPATSLPADVAARWMSSAVYLDAAGVPVVLPLRGRTYTEPSFDALVQSVSKDFHTRSVLDEMLRLGMVALTGPDHEHVRLRPEAMLATPAFAELACRFGEQAAELLQPAAAAVRVPRQTSHEAAPETAHEAARDVPYAAGGARSAALLTPETARSTADVP